MSVLKCLLPKCQPKACSFYQTFLKNFTTFWQNKKTASMPESQYKYWPLRLVLCTPYCTTFSQNKLIRIEVPNSPKRLSIGGVSHAPMLTGEKERQQACQSLSTSTRPCAWYSVLGTVRTVHTQLIRTPRLAVSTAAVEAVGSWGKRRAAVRRCDVRCARRAACGGGVWRRWRGGCGGNGKALYFNAAPYIYSATHSVSLTSTTRLQSWVAL